MFVDVCQLPPEIRLKGVNNFNSTLNHPVAVQKISVMGRFYIEDVSSIIGALGN